MNLPDDLDAALAEFREGLLDTDDAQIQQPALAPQSPQRDIDEEIKVTKKRKTIPKLDDERSVPLCSQKDEIVIEEQTIITTRHPDPAPTSQEAEVQREGLRIPRHGIVIRSISRLVRRPVSEGKVS